MSAVLFMRLFDPLNGSYVDDYKMVILKGMDEVIGSIPIKSPNNLGS
jgi:hypothetical protein